MGTIFYAVNPETQKAYELGKGNWIALCKENDEWTADCSRFEAILQKISDEILGTADPEYNVEIATALCALGPFLQIRDDHDGSNPIAGLELAGSRYRP